MIDPSTYPTSADLSRTDLRLLHRLCLDKSVVEFGCGGSTLFLAEVARELVSYDTDAAWIARVRERCPSVDVRLASAHVPIGLPAADVYFIDGAVHLRALWTHAVMAQRLTKTIIVHDSRRRDPVHGLQLLLTWPHTAILDKVEYHAEGSNCLVITLRDKPVKYEDWNVTEPANRLPKLDKV